MESIDKLIGATLTNLAHLENDLHVLTFKTSTQNYRLKFKGFPFETKKSPVNHIVSEARIGAILGFKSVTTLRTKGLDPNVYQQLFIKMKDSTEHHKIELIAALNPKSIKIEEFSVLKDENLPQTAAQLRRMKSKARSSRQVVSNKKGSGS
jgi:hypothetical protein